MQIWEGLDEKSDMLFFALPPGGLFQEELIYLLRKLMFHMRELPAQTAHCLFNYLVCTFTILTPNTCHTDEIGITS